LVWKSNMPHETSQANGLYFVGISSFYGIGADFA